MTSISIIPTINQDDSSRICMSCGACCAFFRVSFYWAEGEALGIPEAMTSKVNDFYSCMKGTNQPKPCCIALGGEVGKQVACQIYPIRPSACHTVNVGDEQCRKARQMHGLSNDMFNDNDYSKFA